MDLITDKFSIKNLLFTKAIPNYVIPVPINGHKVYACTDCGDKFIFESSYNDHINRKSLKISYNCRYCSPKVFYNRCNLIFHIRSHYFKTATINIEDLKIEPLPANTFKSILNAPAETTSNSTVQTTVPDSVRQSTPTSVICYECKADITTAGIPYKDRASHFMQYTNEVYSCPICLFALPSVCALKIHLRVHLKCPPYYCPECGIHLANKNVQYPYNHDCEGFKMMRATARLKCAASECSLFHPNDFKDHMRNFHLKKVYKCPFCVVACFNESTMDRHLKEHKTTAKPVIFYQCSLCPDRFVMEMPRMNDKHLKSHINATVFPCWACGSHFKEVSNLLTHFIKKHNKNVAIENALNAILSDCPAHNTSKPKAKPMYHVVKRCDQCKRSFTYKCKYDEIQTLPNECPYKCTSTMESNVMPENIRNKINETHITCHLCRIKILQDWNEIKKHYADLHKTEKCLDVKILLTRVDVKKYLSQNKVTSSKPNILQKITKRPRKKRVNKQTLPLNSKNRSLSIRSSASNEGDNSYLCNVCGENFTEKSSLEKHILIHRDPCMAYQCMECGQCFVVKPSFSKHLLLEHGISNVDDYINNKQCYNKIALMKYQNPVEIVEEPLTENQCKICREEFNTPEDLEKHFRTHGMAFLMKNTSKNGTNL